MPSLELNDLKNSKDRKKSDDDIDKIIDIPKSEHSDDDDDNNESKISIIQTRNSIPDSQIATGDELIFTLFEDVEITLTLGEQMPSPLGGDVFLAEASGYDGVKNAVVLRTSDGLTIDVQDYINDMVYKVISTPNGVMVQEIQPSHDVKCGCDALEPSSLISSMPLSSNEDNIKLSASPASTSSSKLLGAAAQQSDTCVDILVAYDNNAAAYANSQGGGVTNFAQVAVQKMNAAIANTGLDEFFRFRLVGVISVEATHDTLSKALNAATYAEAGWEAIKAKRNEVGADVVTILIDTGSGGDADGVAGLGWSLDKSYQSSKVLSGKCRSTPV